MSERKTRHLGRPIGEAVTVDPHETLSDTPEWPSASITAVWTEVQRLTALDDEPLLDQLDDLIDSDIVGRSRVPLSTLITLFVAVWGHSIARRPYFLRSLRVPFESLEHRADRENALDVLAAVKNCCPYLQEVIDDDLDWTHHPIPGEEGGRS